MREVLRIGNCSGFYGDRLSAMREMLEGGDLDVLTGDYLAELTLLILGKDTMKDPALGYARTHVRQLEDCMGLALERGVRIVSNAGGLNPAGLAEKLREVADGRGLAPRIAHVAGDDLRPLGLWEGALTANAYLGGFGIAAALRAGADIVVTGRVTDASLVLGAAAAHHGWDADDHDALAGAVVAGHVLECGTQATGGNFSGFLSLPDRSRPLGFPLAEIAADGSCIITKHDGTGGAVTLDTVTAQLVYEVQSTRYLGPDVTTHLDSITLAQVGPDRVAISGVRGEAPPAQLKVCVNELGGWRNSVEFVLTGLDVEAKADWVRNQLTAALTTPPAEVAWSQPVPPIQDADSEEAASVLLRCTVKDPQPGPVGRPFTSAAVELALGSYPGFTMTAPPGAATPFGIYRAEYVDRSVVQHTVVHADGTTEVVGDPPVSTLPPATDKGRSESPYPAAADIPTRRVPLGAFVHARSGDKGGDANIGLWVAHDDRPDLYADRVAWLAGLVTAGTVRELVPEAADLDVEVHALPNLGAVNVVIRGLLGDGVAASTRFDPQAKGLGEWIRSRHVAIEDALL
ncbi:MAG: hypothetical protein JWN68_2459 [Nocardioides sp.]|jgi:hypothetical protein|uniref:acyclic terpene utilization AtuA family protein n=1 Tax=Nocardioides sp. TaxID=35761 RepID=UPI002630791A|nr:acyclic terpene utilization AtuA family protein [Nocardioides sp.]MCW2834506.1 hypothetical protein [Nocardioides sp.]